MRRRFGSLTERDRRRSAALAAATRGPGGTESIATVPGCDPTTIRPGLAAWEGEAESETGRIRKPGAGARG